MQIKVQPRARRTRLAGKLGGEWKMEVAAPPVDGKANRAVIEFFAKALKLPRSSVRMVAGERSQHKVVEITGATEADIAGIQSRTGH